MKNNNYENYSIGVIRDEIYQAVSAYHIASMGDNSQEIADTKSEYEQMISIYGKKTVQVVVDYYNDTVIGKAK